VKADTTIVDDARNIIFANGNASFETPDGNLKTSKMVWERNLDELSAPGYVVLTRSGDVLRGTNLRTNAKFSYATLDAVSAEGIIDEADFDW
jgi:lipopolysaccharide assembly outer membrane protein LptD (OstA)